MRHKKTIIFINLRFSDFYSKDLFRRVKEVNQVNLVAILDHQFEGKVGEHIKPYLDKIIYLPSYSKEGFLAEFSYEDLRCVVENEIKSSEEVKIVCSDEFNLLNTGKLRRELGIVGHTDEDLLIYRDKTKMKAVLSGAGIRVPRFKLLNNADEFDGLACEIGLPFVMKPIDSCGSHGVNIVHRPTDFEVLQKNRNNLPHAVEVEEFIEGKLYHVDSCVRGGELKFICVNEYTCPNYDYTKGQPLGSIPLEEDNPLYARLRHFARTCLRVLGTNNMVNHMELFVTKHNEIVFLEISGRPPGGFISFTHQINFGFNLMDEDFFMQSEIEMVMDDVNSKEKAFFVLFPLFPGRVTKLNQPPVQSRMDIKWHVAIDDVIDERDCNHIVGKSAHAIFYHENKKILREDFESIKQHLAIEVA